MRASIYIIVTLITLLQQAFCCDVSLIKQIEYKYNIPHGLLKSIAIVESNINPHALNIAGKAFYGQNKEETRREVQKYLKRGVTSIDVGCMQLNYKYHGKNFTSVTHMLEPEANIEYAAKFLHSLYKDTGSWGGAVGKYHSADIVRKIDYRKRVLSKWIKNT